MSERVLSLDMSTKTGWSLLVSHEDGTFYLESFGKLPQIHMPDGAYPESFVIWARSCFQEISKIIDQNKPDVLVIEETSAGSKAIYTQKILEWIHYLMAEMITQKKIKVSYIMTEEWRRAVGCVMSKDEKKRNKQIRDYKKKKEKETGIKTAVAKDENGKRIGLIGRKHVNIRKANEIFGTFLKTPLKRKDEDMADALLLGFAYHMRKR